MSSTEEKTKPLQELSVNIVEQTKVVTEDLKTEYEDFAKERAKFEKQQQEALKFPVSDGVLELNVGGEIFTTTRQTLLKAEGSLIGVMFSGRYDSGPKDKDGRVFLDRPPRWFAVILNSLRSGIALPVPEQEEDLEELKREIQFYGLENYFKTEFRDPQFLGGTLLSKPEYVNQLNRWLKATSKDKNWKLVYKASKDGWDAFSFHSKVDNKGESVTVIEDTKGNLFGGYTPILWRSCGNYVYDNKTFLFSFKNPVDSGPMIFRNTGPYAGSTYSIYDLSSYGPTFGGGNDVFVCSNSNSTDGSYCNLGHSFELPSGMNYGEQKAKDLLTGSYNFMTREIEVYVRKKPKKDK